MIDRSFQWREFFRPRVRQSVRVMLVLAVAAAAWAQTVRSQPASAFLFIPFENLSDFEGKWRIDTDVPRFLAAYMKTRYGIQTISPLVVLSYLHRENLDPASVGDAKVWKQLHSQMQGRFLLTGTIERFDVNKFITNASNIGGYEAFRGEVVVTFKVYDLEWISKNSAAIELFQGQAHGEFSDKSLALTLWGKETQRTIEFRDLEKIPFGSEDFNRTVIGQACLRLAEDFSLVMEEKLPFLRSRDPQAGPPAGLDAEISDSTGIFFRGRIVTGSIVFIEGTEAFVNVGTEDGVRKGQVLSVMPSANTGPDSSAVATTAGKLEVLELRGPHLSLCRIVTGKGIIRSRDKVRTRVIE